MQFPRFLLQMSRVRVFSKISVLRFRGSNWKSSGFRGVVGCPGEGCAWGWKPSGATEREGISRKTEYMAHGIHQVEARHLDIPSPYYTPSFPRWGVAVFCGRKGPARTDGWRHPILATEYKAARADLRRSHRSRASRGDKFAGELGGGRLDDHDAGVTCFGG